MIKVKMLKTTWPHLKDETVEVCEVTANRWQKNNIAIIVAQTEPQTAEPAQTPAQTVRTQQQLQNTPINDLRKEASRMGVTGASRMKKAEIIKRLIEVV